MNKNCKPKETSTCPSNPVITLDYRDFLSELVRQGPRKVTLDKLAQKSGCLSKSYLSLVFSKKRTLLRVITLFDGELITVFDGAAAAQISG